MKDSDGAIRHYAKIRPELALRLYNAVMQAVDRAIALPLSGIPDLNATRTMLVKKYPHRIVYNYDGIVVWIYAVAHFKRRHGYWSRRVPD